MKHRQMGSDAVFRVHEALGIKELTDFISKNAQVPFADKIVRIEPKSPALIKKLATSFPDLAQDCPVRLIKYTYKSKVFYLLTTLTDTLAFPSSIFPDMYHGRWSIEEGYKQIKAHILVNEFHGKCPRTIRQEIFAAVVLINFSRILTMAAETETNSDARSDKKKTIQKKTQRHGNPTNPMPTFSAYN
jgi:IS4 transposase